MNFPISKTMRIAQQLYEGVDIKGQGTVGIITYLRTDSVRVSDEAEAMAKDFISKAMETNIFPPVREQRRAAKISRMPMRQSGQLI